MTTARLWWLLTVSAAVASVPWCLSIEQPRPPLYVPLAGPTAALVAHLGEKLTTGLVRNSAGHRPTWIRTAYNIAYGPLTLGAGWAVCLLLTDPRLVVAGSRRDVVAGQRPAGRPDGRPQPGPQLVRRRARPAVLMIDLDHFNRINDDYGHDAGDSILVEVGQAIRHALRYADQATYRAKADGRDRFELYVNTDLAA